MSNLSLCRLVDLLNALNEKCSAILSPDATTLDDGAIKQRLDGWLLSNNLTLTLTEAALQCDQHGLVGAAKQMRDYSAELVQRGTDILFNDMARHWTVEELAFYRQKYGPFPMPLANKSNNEEIQRDRRMALIGRVHALGDYARSLVDSIENAANQQTEQPELKGTGHVRRGPRKASYETIKREAELAADWEQARDSGTYKAKFAKDKKMTVKEFDKVLNRVSQRKRRSDK